MISTLIMCAMPTPSQATCTQPLDVMVDIPEGNVQLRVHKSRLMITVTRDIDAAHVWKGVTTLPLLKTVVVSQDKRGLTVLSVGDRQVRLQHPDALRRVLPLTKYRLKHVRTLKPRGFMLTLNWRSKILVRTPDPYYDSRFVMGHGTGGFGFKGTKPQTHKEYLTELADHPGTPKTIQAAYRCRKHFVIVRSDRSKVKK